MKKVESRNKEFKDALKQAHRKHEYCMEVVTEQRDDEEEWINSLNDAFCEISEKADAYIEKKIKKSESEILFEGERKYTEELKIHKEEERANVDAAYWWDWKINNPNARQQKWYQRNFVKREYSRQLADFIATCECIHLKYVTLIKKHQEKEEEKTWVLPLVSLYSSLIQNLISCNSKDVARTNEITNMKNNLKLEGLKLNNLMVI